MKEQKSLFEILPEQLTFWKGVLANPYEYVEDQYKRDSDLSTWRIGVIKNQATDRIEWLEKVLNGNQS